MLHYILVQVLDLFKESAQHIQRALGFIDDI